MNIRSFIGYFVSLSACSLFAFCCLGSTPAPGNDPAKSEITVTHPAYHRAHRPTHPSAALIVRAAVIKSVCFAENAEIVPRLNHAVSRRS